MQDVASYQRNYSDFLQLRVNAFKRGYLSAWSWLTSSVQQVLLPKEKVLGSFPVLVIELQRFVWSKKENQATATLPHSE